MFDVEITVGQLCELYGYGATEGEMIALYDTEEMIALFDTGEGEIALPVFVGSLDEVQESAYANEIAVTFGFGINVLGPGPYVAPAFEGMYIIF